MTDSLSSLVVIVVLWVAIGLVLSLVMGRRGHLAGAWLVLGTLLGPLAVILALDASRHDEVLLPRPVGQREASAAGLVDVLVGYDGSPQSAAVVEAVGRLLGERLGRVTVATVVPFDGPVDPERQAAAGLKQFAAGVTGTVITDLQLVHGRPAAALRTLAASGQYELIAVGARGTGLSKHMLGSAARELAQGGDIPVLVVGRSCRPVQRVSRRRRSAARAA
ncbi:MAG: universal stress protein [Acidimicrobiia bacterium]